MQNKKRYRHRHTDRNKSVVDETPPKKIECSWGSGYNNYGKATCEVEGNRKENEDTKHYR
jgi:hypothetical protein